MEAFRSTGAVFADFTVVAKKLSGEEMPDVRFCPWCGWDQDKFIGKTNHRKNVDEAKDADRIGALR